jgi:hypothetical protein
VANGREPQTASFEFFTKAFGILLGWVAKEAIPPAQPFVGFHLTANAFIILQKCMVL